MALRWLFFWLLAAAFVPGGTNIGFAAESRTSLVVGNSHYAFSALANPANDAVDIAGLLSTAGFDVTLKTDADRDTMLSAIRALGGTLKQKGGVGLFYFAGHGVQIGGENYLIPVGEAFAGEADVRQRAVKASEVVDAMTAAGNGLNIVVLDACRDNALGTSATRGLSRVDSNARLFVSFSTSPGTVAFDGAGRNSPYAKALAEALGVPDLTLEQTFKQTLKGVYKETNGKQTPWISSSFFGEFIFRPTKQQVAILEADEVAQKSLGGALMRQQSPEPAPSLSEQVLPPTAVTLTGVYRAEGTNPNGTSYRGMVSVTQTGDRFSFTWWIGQQVFNGTGHLAGRMLVVNWGDKTPVVYTITPPDALDGEWADGTASERLTLHGRAGEVASAVTEGRYRATGRYPNGAAYTGTATITRKADKYLIDWMIDGTAYHGEGTLEGNLFTVNWGGATPVIYALAADGTLNGLWDAGAGEDTLTPEP